MKKGFTLIEIVLVMTMTSLAFITCMNLMTQSGKSLLDTQTYANGILGTQAVWSAIQMDTLAEQGEWVFSSDSKMTLNDITYEFKEGGVYRTDGKEKILISEMDAKCEARGDNITIVSQGEDKFTFSKEMCLP